MPKLLFDGAWFITGLSYTISGVHKLTTISWQSGEALYHLLDNPLVRNNMLVETLLEVPMPLLKLATWSVLLLEILAIVFVMIPKLRKYLGILTTVNFADLTLGMLVFQLFIFDTDWLKSKSKLSEKITLFYDSDCGVCNGFIRFIMDNNSKENIYFAPLQSELGEKVIREHGLENKDTMIVKKEDGVLIESQAVLEIFRELDSFYPIVSWLRFMLGFVRNTGYRIFAKYRHRVFKMETCALLGERERGRFLG
ncbi:DCC1-like thiol-disulfide oxidoreductase family protein [Halobacteriovorax sp. RT-2-4]|uniref:DCC1-like thiol-disulfide oxidoreductase family protein n=1 Tax=unclassified Halobacteriovorax TaxID=2639665 RepID=UPI00399BEC3D